MIKRCCCEYMKLLCVMGGCIPPLSYCNAFSAYSQILEEVSKVDKSRLILIALGPTATVLAYDLSKQGYQAIDIGHLDVEYEWFLQSALDKCIIKNKYVNEVDNREVSDLSDPEYQDQVISVIK